MCARSGGKRGCCEYKMFIDKGEGKSKVINTGSGGGGKGDN